MPMSAQEANHSFFRKAVTFLLICGIGLLFVLTSWLYVAYVIGFVLYRRSRDAGAPQAVREFRWKLRNTDMTFDQIVMALMKISEQDPANFEQVKADLLQDLNERGLHSG